MLVQFQCQVDAQKSQVGLLSLWEAKVEVTKVQKKKNKKTKKCPWFNFEIVKAHDSCDIQSQFERHY